MFTHTPQSCRYSWQLLVQHNETRFALINETCLHSLALLPSRKDQSVSMHYIFLASWTEWPDPDYWEGFLACDHSCTTLRNRLGAFFSPLPEAMPGTVHFWVGSFQCLGVFPWPYLIYWSRQSLTVYSLMAQAFGSFFLVRGVRSMECHFAPQSFKCGLIYPWYTESRLSKEEPC